MKKSPEAFRTISEVAEVLDVPPHVLRFWETRFSQVKPVKRGGGRRYYRPEDVRLLRGIKGLLYDDGLTIKGAQKILREKGIRHVAALGTLPDGEDAPAAKPPAKKSRKKPAAAKGANGKAAPAKKPQPDLFEAPKSAQTQAPDGDPDAIKPLDKNALRTLVGELEALREIMIADPQP
jgi:DNA-binding transcriptional MerR regulator